jgi:hypothetical protein
MNFKIAILLIAISSASPAFSQLAVSVAPIELSGQKAVVHLTLKNEFKVNIESARTVVFLLDEQGKMVAQGTRWVIGGGGSNTNGLAVGATNTFNFVVQGDKPFYSTNLITRISFSRVVLAGGQQADAKKDVIITQSSK